MEKKEYRYNYKELYGDPFPLGDHELEISYDPKKCNGCQVCELACHTGAIKRAEPLALKEKTIIPKDLDTKKCNFCSACVMACPTQALELLIDGKKIEKNSCHHLDWEEGTPLIGSLQIKCRASCNACINACPEGAIELKKNYSPGGRLKVDTEKCALCGACEKICEYKGLDYIKLEIEKVNVTAPKKRLGFPQNCLIPNSEIKNQLKKIPYKQAKKFFFSKNK